MQEISLKSHIPQFILTPSISSFSLSQVMLALINHGANVNAKDKYSLSALHHAAMRGNLVAIRCLLETKGIEKEPRDVQARRKLGSRLFSREG